MNVKAAASSDTAAFFNISADKIYAMVMALSR